ncbi:unnamed protein product [Allacma fusca]|uniref:Uncharacterized protein n=1 Tax=Allacma fusca TaxID=39272 RepID=A0A8J2PKM0_9HEXA|nr:unnamed protein product [Allacma fusca]
MKILFLCALIYSLVTLFSLRTCDGRPQFTRSLDLSSTDLQDLQLAGSPLTDVEQGPSPPRAKRIACLFEWVFTGSCG